MRPAVLRCCGCVMNVFDSAVSRIRMWCAGASAGSERIAALCLSSASAAALMRAAAAASAPLACLRSRFLSAWRSAAPSKLRVSSGVSGASWLMGVAFPVWMSRAT